MPGCAGVARTHLVGAQPRRACCHMHYRETDLRHLCQYEDDPTRRAVRRPLFRRARLPWQIYSRACFLSSGPLPLQHQGNDALKQGLAVRKKFYIRKAVDHYSEGIAAGADDSALNSMLHSNRAQAGWRNTNVRLISALIMRSTRFREAHNRWR